MNHRCGWASTDGFDFAFIIELDGKGIFYDFSIAKAGESRKANAIFKCHRTN
jgi:hypothetical protein